MEVAPGVQTTEPEKIVIRNKVTGLFLTEERGWTRLEESAATIPNFLDLLQLSVQLDLKDSEAILHYSRPVAHKTHIPLYC